MPGFDGTGPMGQGPLTGRQMGYCQGARPGYGAGFGRGLGRGLGLRRGFARGFGFRYRSYPPADYAPGEYFPDYQQQEADQSYQEMKARIQQLESELSELKRRDAQK